MARLAIMCGLPLSGKSSYARVISREEGFTVICPDDVRLALHGRDYHQAAEGFVWASCELMARALLLGEHAVLIDATNTTQKRRAQWARIASEFGIELEAYVMDTSAETCKERADMANKPHMNEIIDRMAQQWEPVREEGLKVAWTGAA